MTVSRDDRPAIVLSMMGLRNVEGIAEGLLHRWNCRILTHDPTTSLLRLRNIPHEPLDDFIPEEARRAAIDETISRIDQAAVILESDPFRRCYPHFNAATWRHLDDVFSQVLRRDILVGMTIVDGLRLAASTCDIRLVVVSEDHMRDNRALVTAARTMGIPTLQVIHASPTGARSPLEPVTTEHVAVFSEHTRNQYISLGVDPGNITITGNPAWDAYMRPPLPTHRRDVCNAMGLDPSRPIITYAITAGASLTATFAAYPRHHLDLVDAVVPQFVALSKKHPDWQFMLRPRPGPDDALPFEAMLREMPEEDRRAITLDRNSPYNSVLVSDVVLSTQSNMGIEAIFLGKAAVNVDIDAFGGAIYCEGFGPLFDANDAVLEAGTPEAIGECIERALLDPGTRDDLERRRPYSVAKFNGVGDGRATERVLEMILRLARAEGGAPHLFYATEMGLREDARKRNEAGERAFMGGDLTAALRCFTEAAGLYRQDPRTVSNLATTLVALGEHERAWDLLVEALHYDPAFGPARGNLRETGVLLGRSDIAETLLSRFGTHSTPEF